MRAVLHDPVVVFGVDDSKPEPLLGGIEKVCHLGRGKSGHILVLAEPNGSLDVIGRKCQGGFFQCVAARGRTADIDSDLPVGDDTCSAGIGHGMLKCGGAGGNRGRHKVLFDIGSLGSSGIAFGKRHD